MKSTKAVLILGCLIVVGALIYFLQSSKKDRAPSVETPVPPIATIEKFEPEIIKGPALKGDQKEVRITRIVPTGEDVAATRQMVFQFNRPIVPIGRMERDAAELPINIVPELDCEWRWINTSALACQLDDNTQLQQATEYTIAVDPGIEAEDGATTRETIVHRFITQRPQARYAWFDNWQAPGSPVIRVTFNQSVSKSSVEQFLKFKVKSTTADLEQAIVDTVVEIDPDDRQAPRFIIAPGESYVLDFGDQPAQKSDDDPRNVGGEEARRIWLVSPKSELPLDSNVDLWIEPGLVSALGAEQGVEDRTIVNFETFSNFKFVGVNCWTNDRESILITPAKIANQVQYCHHARFSWESNRL